MIKTISRKMIFAALLQMNEQSKTAFVKAKNDYKREDPG